MFDNRVFTTSVTIASGESLSGAADTTYLRDAPNSSRLFGIDVPAEWTSANITIYQKHVDGTYKPVYDELGTELTIVATAGATIRFSNPSQFAALSDIKLLSGTSGSPVNQAADRTLSLILRNI